jgi:hypothetical protein
MKNNNDKQQLIEQLKKVPIVQISCERTNISRATYYRWRESDIKFKELSDKAITEGISYINDLSESQLISAIKDKNMTAIIFWLKNRHPSYDTTKLQITSDTTKKEDPLTAEQQQLINKALQMASIMPSEYISDHDQTTK